MSFYQAIILEHYHNPRNFGRLKDFTKTCNVSNPLCGDHIVLDIHFYKGMIDAIMFTAEGCAISKASTSLLTEFAKHKPIKDLKKLDKDFMINLLGVQIGPNRLKCALLPLEALQTLLI